MEKLFEKKNLGIPVTILALLAYFIGYYMTLDFSGLFVAVVFAVVVFALDFDDKVKNAVKQSYFIGLVFGLLYLGLDVFSRLTELFTPVTYTDYADLFILQKVFNNIHHYSLALLNIVVIVVYALFIITVLLKKDVKLNFIFSIFGEGTPKQMQQQVPPMYQQAPPMQQQVQGVKCPKCGAVNHNGATFCASCGNKLN